MQRFNDNLVIVTGGGSGIGRATALAFARLVARKSVSAERHLWVDWNGTLCDEQPRHCESRSDAAIHFVFA